MPSLNDDRQRQVVPRLRNFDVAVGMGELASVRPLSENPFTTKFLGSALHDWAESPSVAVAADLVSVAVTLGRQEVATDAAKFILSQTHAPNPVRNMAAFCLGLARGPVEGAAVTQGGGACPVLEDTYSQIHLTRTRLYNHPQNPVLWVSLARLYTSLAQWRQAARAAHVALSLSTDNRFVLRSLSRLFLHQQDGEKAHAILRRAGSVRHDPWLLAAEVATAAAIGKDSENLKLAQRILESGKFAPAHVSELASAVGTLEAMSSGGRKWRKLIRQSLERPSENAIAQAAWLSSPW